MKALIACLLLCVAAAPAHALDGPLRDPFARPARAAAPAPQAPAAPLRLRALILNGDRSLANIDGEVVAAGDRGPGYTVLRIDARGVLIVRDGRRHLLAIDDPGRDRPRDEESQ